MTLTDFLLARIAEDEGAAGAIDAYRIYPSERWTEARVLAECEAKRHIVEALSRPAPRANGGLRGAVERDGAEWAWAVAREGTLAQLALPYADHPDYREEWRP